MVLVCGELCRMSCGLFLTFATTVLKCGNLMQLNQELIALYKNLSHRYHADFV